MYIVWVQATTSCLHIDRSLAVPGTTGHGYHGKSIANWVSSNPLLIRFGILYHSYSLISTLL